MFEEFYYKPKLGPDDFGWYERNLPHFDSDGFHQFITIRLGDSMPRDIMDKWRAESASDAAFRKRIEKYLDSGYGECWLGRPDVAAIVRDALKFHHDKLYSLISWVVMPNHVHFLMLQKPGIHLPNIIHSIKSYTAHEANKLIGRTGPFWQPEVFDRYIRNGKHYFAVIRYIEQNPVKAGLCEKAGDWEFGSAWTGAAGVPPAILK